MTPAELCKLGKKIHGSCWHIALAQDLARDERTIRRWKSGESPIPKVVANRIRALAAEAGEL